MKQYCPYCKGELEYESIGLKCTECKGFIDMQGIFHKHKEQPFMPPKTNFDKITESVESLAIFMLNTLDCTSCPCGNNGCFAYDNCTDRIKEWLQQEVDDA